MSEPTFNVYEVKICRSDQIISMGLLKLSDQSMGMLKLWRVVAPSLENAATIARHKVEALEPSLSGGDWEIGSVELVARIDAIDPLAKT